MSENNAQSTQNKYMKQTQTIRCILRGHRSEHGICFPVDLNPLVCAGYVHRCLAVGIVNICMRKKGIRI